MKCEKRLVLLLEAEQEELEGRGTSELAVHVRGCARCGAVAARLLADTQVLATHVAARGVGVRSVRRSVTRPLVFGGAIAAAAAIALLLMPAREGRVVAPVRTQTIARVSPAQPESVAKTPVAHLSPPRALVRIRETRFADAVAATPVRFVASESSEQLTPAADFGGVSVAPPPGVRSTVLATRNSKITVVWLY